MLRPIAFSEHRHIVKTARCTNLKSFSSAMATLTPQESSASADWQTTKGTVRDRTAFLFDNSLMSDITFVLTDPDGSQVRVPAHKLVLAISSPVFEAMFYGELAEKRLEIELPDTERPYLLEFLRFLYCDKVDLTTDNAFGVLYLAQKYIVPLLADECWAFIDENTCACLESDNAVSSLNQEMLLSLTKRDTLKMKKEVDLFVAVKHWAEASCRADGVEPDGEAVRGVMGDRVLDSIRFPTMSPPDFALQVVPCGLLTDRDVVEFYQYFYGELPGQKVRFSKKYREGAIGNARIREYCRRHGNTPSRIPTEAVTVIYETLEVSLINSEPVLLKGLQLLTRTGKGKDKLFTADVRLLNQHEVEFAAKRGNFTEKPLANSYDWMQGSNGIVVDFIHPVLIRKGIKYTLKVKLCGVDGAQWIQILPNFSPPSERTFDLQGTSHTIYKLFYYQLYQNTTADF